MNNLIGQHLGPYRILEQIGIGGMATVYKAYQPTMDRYVAVKVIAAHFAQDETFLRRFRREAKAVAQLEHAHILPVHDYGEAEGRPYLVMRFLEAGTLKERMAEEPLPLSEVNRVIGQVGSALDYAHRMGVVHRDVKPANVLLDAEGDSFLTDFGLAKMIESSAQLTATGVGLGTPAYMSPEQGKGAKVDSRADVYSLGVMLYEMVTGRAPYEAETPLAVVLKHIQEPLPLPRSVRPDLPEEVERVILRALAKEPDDRFQTAGEMVRALDAAVRAARAAARTEPAIAAEVAAPPVEKAAARARKPLPAGWRRTAAWVAVGLVALVVLFLVLSRVPLKVQISGGQLEVVRVVEGTGTPVEAGTPTPQPATIPAHMPEPTFAAGTPAPASECRLAFEQNGDIYVRNCDGSGVRQITFVRGIPTGPVGPSWSPDGEYIAFNSGHEGQLHDDGNIRQFAYIIRADGSDLKRLSGQDNFDLHPVWSPDGRRIALSRNCTLVIVAPDGSDERVIAHGSEICSGTIAWSPDGQQLAFVSWHDPFPENLNFIAYVVNSDSTNLRRLGKFEGGGGMVPTWSPDGKQIGVEGENAYLLNADGSGEPVKVSSIPDSWHAWYWPQWDGEAVATAPTPAPGSPADQARAFAEPILAAIADRAPDFEDDFSANNKGWSTDSGCGQIADGRLRMNTLPVPQSDGRYTCGAHNPSALSTTDFVFQADLRLVTVQGQELTGIQWRHTDGYYRVEVNMSGHWVLGGSSSSLPGGGVNLGVPQEWWGPASGTNQIRVIGKGDQFAVYIDGAPVFYLQDDFNPTGEIDLWLNAASGPVTVEYDNVKLWDLDNVPGLPEAAAAPAPSPAATVLAYWPFEGDLKDGSGNSYDLQQTGENLDFVSGCFGQAIQFHDDATSYLTRGQDDDAFDFGSSDYSVELWGKFDRAPSESHEQTLIEKCTGGGCATTGWGATATTTFWRFIHNPGTHVVVDSPPLFWQSGNWYHMVAVRQGETVYLYINGEQVASGWASDIADNDAPLILGRRFDESQLLPLIGALDEVTIYEGALSAAEVRDHYQQGASCAPAGAAPMPSPGSSADQARAFAEPILAAIADRPPDFEDDFSTADERWYSNCGEQGSHTDHFEITEGVARMTLSEESDAYLAHDWFAFKNFVLSLDSRQVSGSYVSGQIVHLGIPNGDFTLNVESGTKTWRLFKAQQDQWSPPLQEGGGDVVSPIGETNHIIVVARGPRLTFYLNDEPVAYIEDKDFDVGHGTFFMCSGQPDIVCEFDNVKLWNLDNVPGLPEAEAIPSTQPTATPTPNPLADQARTLVEPVLAAIADRAPDFEDNFSTTDERWYSNCGEQGSHTDHFEISDGVARMTLFEGSDAYLARDRFVFKNFVLMLESRQASGGYGSGQTVHLGISNGHFTLNIGSGTKTWWLSKAQHDQWSSLQEGSGDVVSPIGETNHILVVARGPRIAYYLNDEPIAYIEDKDFDVGHNIFFMCSGQPDIVCEFDNVKLWNLDNVPGLP